MGIKDVTDGRCGDIFRMDPAIIEVKPGFNLRKSLGDLTSLKAKIKENGFSSAYPIVVRMDSDTPFVCQGHRRLQAVLELISEGVKIPFVPVVNEARGTGDEQQVIDQINGNDGLPLTPLEEAEGFRRLVGFGWIEKEIAAKIGKSSLFVAQRIALLSLPNEIKKDIQAGRIAVTPVQEIAARMASGKITQEDGLKAIGEVMKNTAPSKSGGKPRQKKGSARDPNTPKPLPPKRLHSLIERIDKTKAVGTDEPPQTHNTGWLLGYFYGLRTAAGEVEIPPEFQDKSKIKAVGGKARIKP